MSVAAATSPHVLRTPSLVEGAVGATSEVAELSVAIKDPSLTTLFTELQGLSGRQKVRSCLRGMSQDGVAKSGNLSFAYQDRCEILVRTHDELARWARSLQLMEELGIQCSPKVLALILNPGKNFAVAAIDYPDCQGRRPQELSGFRGSVSDDLGTEFVDDMVRLAEAGYVDEHALVVAANGRDIPEGYHPFFVAPTGRIIIPEWHLRQLEPGESTDFIRRTFQGFVSECQRFFRREAA